MQDFFFKVSEQKTRFQLFFDLLLKAMLEHYFAQIIILTWSSQLVERTIRQDVENNVSPNSLSPLESSRRVNRSRGTHPFPRVGRKPVIAVDSSPRSFFITTENCPGRVLNDPRRRASRIRHACRKKIASARERWKLCSEDLILSRV